MLRRFHIGSLAAVGLLLAATAFAAGRPAPELEPLGNKPIHRGDPQISSVCQLGVLGTPTSLVNYLFPPNDSYYTLIRAADCTACTSPGGVEATIAHALLEFRQAGCSVNMTISIVGAVGTPSCPTPDPTTVLCPPIQTSFTAPGTGVYDIPVPLPAGCCISNTAFLCITIDALSCNQTADRPRLVTNGSAAGQCVGCTSYNIYPGGNDELCALGFPGNPMMSLEVECCNAVPTRTTSWGTLKVRYTD